MPGQTEPEPVVPVVTARRGLAAWPIRRKLVALVAGPLVVLLGAGIFFTAQSISSLRASQRARDLANAALLTNHLTSAMDNEMKLTLDWLAEPTSIPKRTAKNNQQAATNAAWKDLSEDLKSPPGGAWSPRIEAARSDLVAGMDRLYYVRKGAEHTNGRIYIQSQYVQKVKNALDLLSALTVDLSTSTPSAATVDAAATIGSLSLASDAAAQESVRLLSALTEQRISDRTSQNLQELKVTQDYQLDQARAHGTDDQQAAIATIRTGDDQLKQFRQDALNRVAAETDAAQQSGSLDSDQAKNFAVASWARVEALNKLTDDAATATRDDAEATARNGLVQTGLVSALAILGLLLGFALVTYIARTVTGPMRRLRAGAVDAATVRLPAMVRQIEREGAEAVVHMPPVLPSGTNAGPETLEVAQAVDGLTAEAVRLATAQVRLRHALDEAFVSMSRRSQSMVEKQLAIIDELESTEEDPEQLRNLFRLDHLAARMRRYNDNLLVLAGSTLRTRSAAPVPIADVFRAATSEMEQYERVRLQPVNGVAVSGPVAGGLVHLLAELLDNAAMYSPPTSPILLSGTLNADGGLHLEITDSGVGIPPSELADLNGRLATPGSIDTQVPSRMGLYVVARLAQRGSFGVRLAPRANAAGTVAEVDVPAAMVVGSGRTSLPGQPGAGGAGGPGGPGQGGPGGPGGSPRPDGPRLPGSPEPGRIPSPSPAMSGGMRLDPALRLTGRPGGPTGTSPRGIPALPGGPGHPGEAPPPAERPGERPAAAMPSSAPAAASAAPAAPAANGPGAPAGAPRSAGGAPGGLPSRRPGAALASNPLVTRPGGGEAPRPGFEAFGGLAPASGAPVAPNPGTAAAAVGAMAAARAGLPPATTAPPSEQPAARTSSEPQDRPDVTSRTSPVRPPLRTPGYTTGPDGRHMPPPAPVMPSGPTARAGGAAPPQAPVRPVGPVPTGLQGPSAPQGPSGPQGLSGPQARGPRSAPQPPAPAPAPTAPPAPPEPEGPSGPRFEAPLTSDLPRRTRGTTLAGTPLAVPRPDPTPLNGIEAAQMFGPGAESGTGPHALQGPGSGSLPLPGQPREQAPAARSDDFARPDGERPDDADGTRPPIRPFAQPRSGSGPSRPPFRPGASSAQAGASAATAAAAAARARAAASGREPTPGTGLFAATGPATLPAGIRPTSPAPRPVVPGGNGRADGGLPGLPVRPESGRPVVPMTSIPPVAIPGAAPPASLDGPTELDRPAPVLAGSFTEDATPIFDSISAWFATEPAPGAVAAAAAGATGGRPGGDEPLVIDLRDSPATVGASASPAPGTPSRWAALGDQRWLATNARAAANPEIAGNTQAGLPRRQPGANLLPSAVEAAPGRAATAVPTASEPLAAGVVTGSAPSAGARPDADAVRGRLGSYQRGLTTARRARHLPGTGTTRQALGESESRPQDAGQRNGDQGGNQ